MTEVCDPQTLPCACRAMRLISRTAMAFASFAKRCPDVGFPAAQHQGGSDARELCRPFCD